MKILCACLLAIFSLNADTCTVPADITIPTSTDVNSSYVHITNQEGSNSEGIAIWVDGSAIYAVTTNPNNADTSAPWAIACATSGVIAEIVGGVDEKGNALVIWESHTPDLKSPGVLSSSYFDVDTKKWTAPLPLPIPGSTTIGYDASIPQGNDADCSYCFVQYIKHDHAWPYQWKVKWKVGDGAKSKDGYNSSAYDADKNVWSTPTITISEPTQS
jgi:hypothetical protein